MKFNIRDIDGTEYSVDEIEEVKEADIHDDDDVEIDTTEIESSELSPEEVSALKRLAAVADKLVEMVGSSDVHDDEDDFEEEKEIVEEASDGDYEEADDDEEETVVDTKKMKDSFNRSAFKTEKRKKIDDSLEVDEISEAWDKRYNGGKK